MEFPFLNGCVLGFSIAAPVGPIGVLCIRRSLADGFRVGFFTGLGAAAADAAYGASAAFGITALAGFLQGNATILRLLGGFFMLGLGIKTILSRPAASPATAASQAGAFASTFFLTLANPMTMLSFLAIFTGLGLGSSAHDWSAASRLTAGVFIGSAAWWLFLSAATSYWRSRLTVAWMRHINRASGAIIIAFAAAILWKALAR